MAQTTRNLPEFYVNQKSLEVVRDQFCDVSTNETELCRTQPKFATNEPKQNWDYSVHSATDVVCTCALMPSYEQICESKEWLESIICYAKLINTFKEYQRLCKETRIRELLANLAVLRETYQQQLKTIAQHKMWLETSCYQCLAEYIFLLQRLKTVDISQKNRGFAGVSTLQH